MKSLLRQNPTIAFGLGLPLLLVIVFLLVSGVPALLVSAPQYDLLYATGYDDYSGGIQIDVVDQHVQVIHQTGARHNRKPRLWRYQANTGAVKEVPMILPAGLAVSRQKEKRLNEVPTSTLVPVPDLKGVVVDSSSIAPDGYEFSLGQGRYSRNNVFGSLFYSSGNRYQGVLTKNGRSIQLPKGANQYYGRNTRFIGWVISP